MSSLTKSLWFLWLSHLFMDFFTGIWPIYKTLANIDIAQAGLIAGVSGFLGEIFQVLFGYFSDRGYRKRVLLLGLVLSSSILWITFAQGISGSFLLLLLLMLGSGSFHPAAMGMAGALAGEKKKGSSILFFASGGAIGLGISQLAFTKLREVFQGHALIVFAPLLILIVLLIFHQFPKQVFAQPTLSLRGFFQPIMHCRKPLLLLYLSQVAVQGLVLSFMFLLPDILATRKCDSWLCMGGGHLCFVLGSALTMVPAGWLCDKYGQKKVLLTVVCGAGLLFYTFLTHPATSIGQIALMLSGLGAFLGIINPIIVSWGNRLVPESPSTVSALLMGFAWCFSNLGPAFAGFLAKFYVEEPYLNAIASLGGLLFLIFFFVLFMPRPEMAKKAVLVNDDQQPLQ
ncbi:MAG: MFS transporter [Chlamydiales bacterium]|nr:MFS transporter [Chlamydiales bacterium]